MYQRYNELMFLSGSGGDNGGVKPSLPSERPLFEPVLHYFKWGDNCNNWCPNSLGFLKFETIPCGKKNTNPFTEFRMCYWHFHFVTTLTLFMLYLIIQSYMVPNMVFLSKCEREVMATMELGKGCLETL